VPSLGIDHGSRPPIVFVKVIAGKKLSLPPMVLEKLL
jgi:hypothetical protein